MAGKKADERVKPDPVARLLEGMRLKDLFDEHCVVNQALVLLADKWTLLVLLVLLQDKKRYSELQRQILGVSPKMLTQTLRSLEQNGLVEREIFPEIPPRVEYSLTPFGRSLGPVLAALFEWSVEHEPQVRAIYSKAKKAS